MKFSIATVLAMAVLPAAQAFAPVPPTAFATSLKMAEDVSGQAATMDKPKKKASFDLAPAASKPTSIVGKKDMGTKQKIDLVFPGSLTNKQLVKKVFNTLKDKGYTKKNTLVATSLCADEVNRPLERDFNNVYESTFHMGGLAGFPFGGVTSFGAMASHIPDDGNTIVVFGPHVGVDGDGNVGTVERRGRANGGACCGSAVAASNYVASVLSGEADVASPPTVPTDAQQAFVGNMLLPYAERLDVADDKMVELPYALYSAQKEMITDIVTQAAGAVGGDGVITVLGGIQINTNSAQSDYFMPLSMELYNNKGEKIEDLRLE